MCNFYLDMASSLGHVIGINDIATAPKMLLGMVGDILNQGGERLQNPSTPGAVNNNNFFEDN